MLCSVKSLIASDGYGNCIIYEGELFMKKSVVWQLLTLMLATVSVASEKHDYPLSPMSFEQVTLQDNFWLPRLKTQTKVTIPFALEKTEPAVENLRRCGNYLHGRGGERPFTHRFVSSDLYKVMEGAAYTLMIKPDPELERKLDGIIDVIADAQQDDGYLYVSHICKIANPREMGETPYSWIVHSHELYNMGHMYEGAIAYHRATGKDKWLKVAEKSARHFNRVIFEGDPNYNNGKPVMQAPGHEELELALCKLYRVTGKKLYLDMARRFIDIRGVTYCPQGEGVMAPVYAQQHKPVRQQARAVGHAVRAAYLYAGMADVAALTGDMTLADALEKIWHNIVDTKMHITGGLGAVHGIEGFGPEYVLPNKNTYDETCAAVANVFFNFRMYLLHKDARYFDVAEVALLNNGLAGVSISGDRFFYVNPLEADGIKMFNHGSGGRSPWFGCACCPSNLARLMPQVPGYMYAHTDNEIYLTLYGSSQTEIPMPGGKVGIKQISDYPFDGNIALKINPSTSQKFALKLRIPTWARNKFVPGELYSYIDGLNPQWTLEVNGKRIAPKLAKGFATIERTWKRGDKVVLNIPMPLRYNDSTDKVKANIDRIAVTRGPLVYCAEEADNGNGKVQRFFVPKPARAADTKTDVIKDGPLNGVVMASVPGMEITEDSSRPATVKLVPYYAWSNRGDASMIVWMPRNAKLAAKSMISNLLTQSQYGKILATHTYEEDTIAAVTDGKLPRNSSDQTIPRWTSLPQKNRRQRISIDFDKPKKVGNVAIYWYQDPQAEGKVKLPRGWWLEYKEGDGEWKRMKKYITDTYGLEKDTFNVVRPDATLKCDGICINVLPQVGYCMGILEIQLGFED